MLSGSLLRLCPPEKNISYTLDMEGFRFGDVLNPSSFRGALDDSKEIRWGVFKRIGFRYLFCYLILYYEPFGAIPGIALLVGWCSQMCGQCLTIYHPQKSHRLCEYRVFQRPCDYARIEILSSRNCEAEAGAK
jgi:hypothetical protein